MKRNSIYAYLSIALWAFPFNNCRPMQNNFIALPDSLSEEYKVYDVLINSIYVASDVKLIVIEDSTGVSTYREGLETTMVYIKRHFDALEQLTINNFIKKNVQRYRLGSWFCLKVKFTIITREEIKKIFWRGRGWDEFYEIYPNSQGILRLSRVGLDNEVSQAVVYVGNQEHWLAGKGYYVFLVKDNKERWKVKDKVMIWVS